ncbi:glycosyltransferase family 2 protein [Celeribacter baekdonensis]|uniref:glycosyltransferase family 2 protein n=1 Tax=Celeribacter baekdonensis TaxID=875171 RepID=UPI003A912214
MRASQQLWHKYRLRLRRRRLLLRALHKRRELTSVTSLTGQIAPSDILCFATVRNEAVRLPYFLDHHRAMGVSQFLIVDNDSDDGTAGYLADQKDVSLWRTGHSYRSARFGMDWITWLQMRYGRGHWCLTLDADEALVIPHQNARDLHDLTTWLNAQNRPFFSALMLDLYPKTRLSEAKYTPGRPFTEALGYYDAKGYTRERHPKYGNVSIRGGVRKRVFFKDEPDLAPHMHKTPLIKWHWRYAYASSTHIALPTELNEGFEPRHNLPTGVLLHAKFLDEALRQSTSELIRQEHFTQPENYNAYYDAVTSDPILWDASSQVYRGWEGLEADGVMARGAWA